MTSSADTPDWLPPAAARQYQELKTELAVCQIGGLFVALYQDWQVAERIITRLQEDLPDHFQFPLRMSDEKTWFPIFFDHTFEQTGEHSDIFHLLDISGLPDIGAFLKHLQYNRERFKAKAYSLVFWLTPAEEKKLFELAPDFHHWVFGTYDFSAVEPGGEVPAIPLSQMDLLPSIEQYLRRLIWQYEHWQEVKDSDGQFLNEVMSRKDLYQYYVNQHCTDEDGQVQPLEDLLADFLQDDSRSFLALLGDFGTGKSSFCLKYFITQAKAWLQNPVLRIPLFISLKNYPKELNIYQVVQQEFFEKFGLPFSLTVFQSLALQGRFIFMVDGFDEMFSKTDETETVRNFKTLTRLSFENLQFMTQGRDKAPLNKVFMTCRTNSVRHVFCI